MKAYTVMISALIIWGQLGIIAVGAVLSITYDPGSITIDGNGDYSISRYIGTPTPNYTPAMIAAAYTPSLEIAFYAQPDTVGLNLGFGANYAQDPSNTCEQVHVPCCSCKHYGSDQR
ncbi:hypothetical protein JXA80_14000 [bacterium]|nr:hypothetical protein [candidate division CSSED10-310 bacterium]